MTRARFIGIVVGLASCVLGWWILFGASRSVVESRKSARVEPDEPVTESPAPVIVEPSTPKLVTAPVRSAPPQLASDGIPIMQARGDSTKNGPRHPHPFAARHQRIFRENALLGALNAAVDAADPESLRRLSQQYQAEYPEDEPQLQSGYDLIADCLESADAETTARAQRYFDEERGSTLRRYVKKYCL